MTDWCALGWGLALMFQVRGGERNLCERLAQYFSMLLPKSMSFASANRQKNYWRLSGPDIAGVERHVLSKCCSGGWDAPSCRFFLLLNLKWFVPSRRSRHDLRVAFCLDSPLTGSRVLYKCTIHSPCSSLGTSTPHEFDPGEFFNSPFSFLTGLSVFK